MEYHFADCVLDDQSFTLTRDGEAQSIEPQVFDLVLFLLRNQGSLIDKDRLIEEIWGGRIVSDSAISAAISAVRRAVGDTGKAQAIIRTIPRRGFQFVAQVETVDEPPSPSSPSVQASARPTVRYATADDGAKIAYTVSGSGPPMVRVAHHPTHLELDWDEPVERQLVETFHKNHTMIRWDQRGCGLSDWDVDDFSTGRSVEDLLAVVQQIGLSEFILFGNSSGAQIAVEFAAKYPKLVTHLVLQGGYVDGRSIRDNVNDPPVQQERDVILKMAETGWETPGSPYVYGYLSVYFPTARPEQLRLIAENLQKSCPVDNEIRGRDFFNSHSSSEFLPQVEAPTLVIHASNDAVHPLSEGQKLAKGIAGAQLIVLDSPNHHPLPQEKCWAEMFESIQRFLHQ